MSTEQTIFSLAPIIEPDSMVLILGSIPGQISLMKQQYYANPRNHFWTILSTLFGEKKKNDYVDKLAFLRRHKIALWDSIHQCIRKGSLDSAIRGEEPNDIKSLLKAHPDIKLIAFNGGKSYSVFKKYIGFSSIQGIDYTRLPSSSPVPGRYTKSFEEKVEIWKVIGDYLD
ncbi:DNA-deoxyinosine glycosylase [Sporolactobacillus putidus]|uniref:DNA-deoxyinosine glycosylase n=1 Tax=Sporolactobacillus putidus TaxID=492735 RepID=A0A917S7B0_9BACL|nr:DNA-deoxyinosine glycosylase [Sporolactobacillus putidus]GGL61126.1 DNA-deoxyinosine glycosylase [Sporolactobacillus putidus]